MNCISRLLPFLAVPLLYGASANQPPGLLSDPVDISGDFREYSNTYFLADRLAGFDPVKGEGSVLWRRNELVPRIAFDNMEPVLRPFGGVTFPKGEYAVEPSLPFSIQFVSPRTVRIRMRTGARARPDAPSLMLVGEPPHDNSWKYEKIAGGHRYTSAAGSVTILEDPRHIEFRDAQGRLLTRTNHTADY
jgi:alpha-D-xyloside xylohydrolase